MMPMSADTQSVLNELTPIFQNVFENDELVIDENTTSADVEGWDSLAHIRLIVSIERALKIRFAAAEIATLANVGELARVILQKKSTG
jgi:acyl carrier protein